MNVTVALLIALGIVTLALLVIIGVLVWVLRSQNNRELKYIHWAMSKSIQEFNKAQEVHANIVTDKKEDDKYDVPQYTPETSMTDDDWYEKIKDINSKSGVS